MSNIFLSSIGSRGDVQPLLALALELKARGHEATLCVAPDFKSWIESFGIACVSIGPSLKGFSNRAPSGKRVKFSKQQAQQMVAASVRNSFQVMGDAAKGADLILVGGALQTAGRSIAEALKIPYVYVAYAAMTLPSAEHPPWRIRSQWFPKIVNQFFWLRNNRGWNTLFRDAVNEQRASLELTPIDDMTRYLFTDQPWLAADAVLSPAGRNKRLNIFQTGAWLFHDPAPLPESLETFLANGEPPIYFGFGSTVSPGVTIETLLGVARKLGRRAIFSKGWANLSSNESSADHISIDEVDHHKLFPRVAAIVHHGGAGTTTTAARAGTPQLIVPQSYDQFYWAHRIKQLRIGASINNIAQATADEITRALQMALSTETASHARTLAAHVTSNGVAIAANRLIERLH